MRLNFLRTTTFRWTITISTVFLAAALLLVASIYQRTVSSNETRIDNNLIQEVRTVTAEDAENALVRVQARLMEDPRRVRFAALFGPDRQLIAGNMNSYPPDFVANGKVHDIVAERIDSQGIEVQTTHAVGALLTNGNTYIIARNFDDFAPLKESITDTVTLGLFPATILALVCGVLLSMRTQSRIEDIHQMAQRIMAGHLHERLPSRGTRDDFDKLVDIMNAMLNQIEHLMSEVKGVGDDIAHDLRTPLTRVRAALERGRDGAQTLEDLRHAVDKGIIGIDQALGVTTALLRIAAIEHGQRNAGFGKVDLGSIIADIVELYEPAAEDKGLRLVSTGVSHVVLRGDRDLLFEAISNLIDNVLKFTPAGGTVSIELFRTEHNVLLRVVDTGPGIPAPEREAVFRRFYRSDKSRHAAGMGLGLALVAAVSKLHGFRVHVAERDQGCAIEMICSPA